MDFWLESDYSSKQFGLLSVTTLDRSLSWLLLITVFKFCSNMYTIANQPTHCLTKIHNWWSLDNFWFKTTLCTVIPSTIVQGNWKTILRNPWWSLYGKIPVNQQSLKSTLLRSTTMPNLIIFFQVLRYMYKFSELLLMRKTD